MKYIIMVFIVWLHLPASGQPNDSLNRKLTIEKCMQPIYSAKEFRRVADSLWLSIDELCDYPIIFPVKKPQRISSGFGMRYHPIYKVRKFHTGIDIPKVKGTPVYATGNGVVTYKGNCLGYGYFVDSARGRFPLVLCAPEQDDGQYWGFGCYRYSNCLCGQYRNIDRQPLALRNQEGQSFFEPD